MRLSIRQRRIVELLLSQEDEITAAHIAAEVGSSTRTIHRELRDMEPILAASGVTLLKKSGIGIKLHIKNGKLDRLKQMLNHIEPAEYSAEERKVLIVCKLLEAEEPIKQFSLAHELRVTMPTISNDLDEIENQFIQRPLILIRRRGYGIELHGSELMKRKLINKLAIENLEDSDLFGHHVDAIMSPITAQLLAMVDKEHFFKLERALWKLNEHSPLHLSEDAYTRLLIKLSAALTRITQGRVIDTLQLDDSPTVASSDSSQLIALLNHLELELPSAEKKYMGGLLSDEVQHDDGLLIHHLNMSLNETVHLLIQFMEESLQLSFSHDRSLSEGLVQHLRTAVQRLNAGTPIRNPILAQIKKDYEPLFMLVKQGVYEYMNTLSVPDEEIGYIVMHFGASIERLKQFPRKIRAVLVCTGGIGSSKLLAVRISKEFPQMELLGHLSWYEAARLPVDNYDLIISTVDLPLQPDRYIKLTPLLTSDEAKKLRHYIQDITLKNSTTAVPADVSKPAAWDRIKQLHRYTQIVLQLLDGFKVRNWARNDKQPYLENHLPLMIASLDQSISEANQLAIAAQLLRREQQGSVMMPDSAMALIHTRSEWIEQPVISLFRFSEPLLLLSDGTEAAKQILMMLGPSELDPSSLEVLSEISAMLLMPEFVKLLETGHTAAIKAFISEQLENYMKTKLEWRDE